MIQTNITSYLPFYRIRRIPVVFITMLLGILQFSCSDNTGPVSDIESDEVPRLNIKIANAFQDEFLNPISKSYTRTSEDFIQQVSIYVFTGEEPVKLRDVRYANGTASATLPPLGGSLSVFVIANENIEAPASKRDLQRRMARTIIGAGGIPSTGMPMGSPETTFRISPKGQTNVSVSLERCHSAIYVETPTGRNNNYRISLTGEQRNQGALVSGSTMLAPSATNSAGWTQGYPLSDVPTREPVAYYYPTDGEITIKVQPVNTLLPPINISLDRHKAGLRNRKYILRIVPGATDGNTKSETPPLVTLIEEG